MFPSDESEMGAELPGQRHNRAKRQKEQTLTESQGLAWVVNGVSYVREFSVCVCVCVCARASACRFGHVFVSSSFFLCVCVFVLFFFSFFVSGRFLS